MYKSPFIVSLMDEVAKEVAEGIDDFVMKATVNAGITVDKDELVKALAYDRGQYDKGYCDGYQDGKQDAMEVVRCRDCALCSIGADDPWCWCLYWLRGTDPVAYCSYGKRREENI